MKSVFVLGLLAIAAVNFSNAGPINKLGNTVQFKDENQPLNALEVKEETEEAKDETEDLEAADAEPCVVGGDLDPDCDGINGTAGRDYPAYTFETILLTFKFNCAEHKYPGFYADPEFGCQIYHICANNQHWTSICNNGTIFDQRKRACVHYFNFDCTTAVAHYDVNVDSFIPWECNPATTDGDVDVQAVLIGSNETKAVPWKPSKCVPDSTDDVRKVEAVHLVSSEIQSGPLGPNAVQSPPVDFQKIHVQPLGPNAVQSPHVDFQKIHVQAEKVAIVQSKDNAPGTESFSQYGFRK